MINQNLNLLTREELLKILKEIKENSITKLTKATTSHSTIINAPKKWEGSRVLIIKL